MNVLLLVDCSPVKLAFRRDPQGDPGILAEARRVVSGYLAHKLA
jgi:hypothetical protein